MLHYPQLEVEIFTPYHSSIKINQGKDPDLHELKVPVSIIKLEEAYEVMVFAPRRVKENFAVNVSGEELIITYHPAEDALHYDWDYWQSNHGGFERTFLLDHPLDDANVYSNYEGGMLRLVLPIL